MPRAMGKDGKNTQKNGCGSRQYCRSFYFYAARRRRKKQAMNDAFSKCHPAVNFLFFAGVICLSVLIQHPWYLLAGAVTGTVYYLLLNGRKGWRTVAALVPLFVLVTVINPIFNTMGRTALFTLFGRPYTMEALLYGAALGAVFVVMLLWFGCYGKVLTGDKFTSLFGSLIPSVSLLLVMVLRMIPNFVRKTRQIVGARRSIGKGAGERETMTEKVRDGVTVLDALTGWALEGSIVTGDSMRARGYGAAKRTSFMIYRMGAADWTVLAVTVALLALTVTAMCLGQTSAFFVPKLKIAPINWGLAAYTGYLLIPIILHVKEAVQWRISRSKI